MIIDFSYDVDSYQELLTHYGNWRILVLCVILWDSGNVMVHI